MVGILNYLEPLVDSHLFSTQKIIELTALHVFKSPSDQLWDDTTAVIFLPKLLTW